MNKPNCLVIGNIPLLSITATHSDIIEYIKLIMASDYIYHWDHEPMNEYWGYVAKPNQDVIDRLQLNHKTLWIMDIDIWGIVSKLNLLKGDE